MRIVALSGGTLSGDPGAHVLNQWLLQRSSAARPRVCFIPTAGGDSADSIVSFYTAFTPLQCRPSHLTLFGRTVRDLRAFILEHDIVYVAGGNTANMLAIWRTQGLDAVLKEAWESGVILSGFSAGALCWFEGGSTDSFGPDLAPLTNGLGFLPGSFCPHYDSEPARPESYRRFVHDCLPDGWALEDGAGLYFENRDLCCAFRYVEDARVLRVARNGEGATETPVPTVMLS